MQIDIFLQMTLVLPSTLVVTEGRAFILIGLQMTTGVNVTEATTDHTVNMVGLLLGCSISGVLTPFPCVFLA